METIAEKMSKTNYKGRHSRVPCAKHKPNVVPNCKDCQAEESKRRRKVGNDIKKKLMSGKLKKVGVRGDYVDHLSMAIVMGNKGLAERLCGFSEQDYASEDVDAGKIIYLLAWIETALAMGDDEDLGAALAKAEKQLSKKSAKYGKLMTQALVSLAQAIRGNDQKAFDDALAARAKDFARLNAHPDDRESPEALTDIPGMAFIRLGLSKGLKCAIGSVYWPETILWR